MIDSEIKLQILISTYGREGIERVARAMHPQCEGVQYIVAWQHSDNMPVPEKLIRKDFRIAQFDNVGLSRNRNNSISMASAQWCLISDDDIDYTHEQLKQLLSVLYSDKSSQTDIVTFKYASQPQYQKKYCDKEFDLRRPPKGYYFTSFEIAFRLSSIKKKKITFNENFGIGAIFGSGEEDVFIFDCLSSGLRGRFFPQTICTHMGSTTSDREKTNPNFIQTKGAVFLHIKPLTWFAAMIVHALRSKEFSTINYIKQWLVGVKVAVRENVFS